MRRVSVTLLLILWSAGMDPSSAQSEGKQLVRAVGQSVTFEAAVLQRGFLKHESVGIAAVIDGKGTTDFVQRFKGRVSWDSQTGLFKITDLNTQDSGNYNIQNNDGQETVKEIFFLKVYSKVSKPQVSTVSQVSESCSLLCSVSNGREVTLSWQRDGTILDHTSNPDLNTPLTLPLETEGLSHSYSCVASNPVSNETVSIQNCKETVSTEPTVPIVLGVLSVIVVVVSAALCYWKHLRDKNKEGPHSDVVYADVQLSSSQPQTPGSAPSPKSDADEPCVYAIINT
ncbi:SLAM family member 5-like isoform X2 [Lepisosteus oculatus]|uniref:SLAM family member 5-like isoform X2 n=1 Tax=Lepisosteus oculatus TaxID=7918 RepID=UPI003720C557